MNIEKPIYFKNDVWDFLLSKFNNFSDDELRKILKLLKYKINSSDSRTKLLEKISDEPSAFLLHIGILDNPDLMGNMILRIVIDKKMNLEDEYIISDSVIEALKHGDEYIYLARLGDKENDLAITREAIAENLARHCEIDYLEINRTK